MPDSTEELMQGDVIAVADNLQYWVDDTYIPGVVPPEEITIAIGTLRTLAGILNSD